MSKALLGAPLGVVVGTLMFFTFWLLGASLLASFFYCLTAIGAVLVYCFCFDSVFDTFERIHGSIFGRK